MWKKGIVMCIVQVMKEDRQRDGATVSSSVRKEPKTFPVCSAAPPLQHLIHPALSFCHPPSHHCQHRNHNATPHTPWTISYLLENSNWHNFHNFHKGSCVNDNVCKSCASSNLLFLFVLLRLCTESLLWQEGGLMFQRCAPLIAAQSSDSSTNSFAQCGCWMLVHHTLSRQLMNKQLWEYTKQPNGRNTLQDIIQSNPNELKRIICFAHKTIFKCCLQSEIKQKDKWCWMMRSAQRSRAAQLD